MFRILISCLFLQFFLSTCNTGKINFVEVNVTMDGFSFSLGESSADLIKQWSDLRKDHSYSNGISVFSTTYEEHHYSFYFYNDRLVKTYFILPPGELESRPFEINKERLDKMDSLVRYSAFKKPTYYATRERKEFDGIPNIHVIIAYHGAESLIAECMSQ